MDVALSEMRGESTGRVARGAAHAGTLLVRDGGGMPESGGARRQRGGDARKGDGEGEGEGRRAHAPRGRDVPFLVWVLARLL